MTLSPSPSRPAMSETHYTSQIFSTLSKFWAALTAPHHDTTDNDNELPESQDSEATLVDTYTSANDSKELSVNPKAGPLPSESVFRTNGGTIVFPPDHVGEDIFAGEPINDFTIEEDITSSGQNQPETTIGYSDFFQKSSRRIRYISRKYDSQTSVGFGSECWVYRHLTDLRGASLLPFHGLYRHTGTGCINLCFGLPHPDFWMEASPDMPTLLKLRCVAALQGIHEYGILHGSVDLSNYLIGADGRVTVVDFRNSALTNREYHHDQCPLPLVDEKYAKLEMLKLQFRLSLLGVESDLMALREQDLINEAYNKEQQRKAASTPGFQQKTRKLSEYWIPEDIWKARWVNPDRPIRRYVMPDCDPEQLSQSVQEFINITDKDSIRYKIRLREAQARLSFMGSRLPLTLGIREALELPVKRPPLSPTTADNISMSPRPSTPSNICLSPLPPTPSSLSPRSSTPPNICLSPRAATPFNICPSPRASSPSICLSPRSSTPSICLSPRSSTPSAISSPSSASNGKKRKATLEAQGAPLSKRSRLLVPVTSTPPTPSSSTSPRKSPPSKIPINKKLRLSIAKERRYRRTGELCAEEGIPHPWALVLKPDHPAWRKPHIALYIHMQETEIYPRKGAFRGRSVAVGNIKRGVESCRKMLPQLVFQTGHRGNIPDSDPREVPVAHVKDEGWKPKDLSSYRLVSPPTKGVLKRKLEDDENDDGNKPQSKKRRHTLKLPTRSKAVQFGVGKVVVFRRQRPWCSRDNLRQLRRGYIPGFSILGGGEEFDSDNEEAQHEAYMKYRQAKVTAETKGLPPPEVPDHLQERVRVNEEAHAAARHRGLPRHGLAARPRSRSSSCPSVGFASPRRVEESFTVKAIKSVSEFLGGLWMGV